MAVTEIRITAKLNGMPLPHYPLVRRAESGSQHVVNTQDYGSLPAATQLNVIGLGSPVRTYQALAQRVRGQRVLFAICGAVSLDAVKPKLDDGGAIISTLNSVADANLFAIVLTEAGIVRVEGGVIIT